MTANKPIAANSPNLRSISGDWLSQKIIYYLRPGPAKDFPPSRIYKSHAGTYQLCLSTGNRSPAKNTTLPSPAVRPVLVSTAKCLIALCRDTQNLSCWYLLCLFYEKSQYLFWRLFHTTWEITSKLAAMDNFPEIDKLIFA